MGSKKKYPPNTGVADLPALRIGSRVRCTDDGVMGRLVWANAASVKIAWDDGEQVTWRHDSLAGRPLRILGEDAAGADQPTGGPPLTAPAPEPASPEPAVQAEVPAMQADAATMTAHSATASEAPANQPVPPAAAQTEAPAPVTGSTVTERGTAAPAKPRRQRKAPAAPKEKKVSALEAAARVLAEAGQPMTAQETIEAMAAKGYWTSPGGKTPAATLYSAILRETQTKGAQARFTKTERGKFARKPGA
jgi:hypothetical protein